VHRHGTLWAKHGLGQVLDGGRISGRQRGRHHRVDRFVHDRREPGEDGFKGGHFKIYLHYPRTRTCKRAGDMPAGGCER
jgi:hypothetical protein